MTVTSEAGGVELNELSGGEWRAERGGERICRRDPCLGRATDRAGRESNGKPQSIGGNYIDTGTGSPVELPGSTDRAGVGETLIEGVSKLSAGTR